MTRWRFPAGVLGMAVALVMSSAQALPAAVMAPSVYRSVSTISIAAQSELEAQAEAGKASDSRICAAFKLPPSLILRVLRQATEVDSRTYAHDLDVAPCQSRGALQLANGLQGSWIINMSGSARVEFEDGRILLLHCRFCGKPFAR
ncbi:hypothetical protein DBR42_00030 [Pelomonas sp. HMWF004]|nr:hypothetical protein DBR42_00030 [Pelomonas sp. HMWF004]